MTKENPTYVLLNGQKDALTKGGFGEIQAKQGEKCVYSSSAEVQT